MSAFVVLISGFILLFASCMKFSASCHGCPDFCIFGSCAANIVVATLEAIMGFLVVTLNSGVLRRRIAVVSYSVLFAASFLVVVLGSKSCNCFGYFSPRPSFVLLLDGFVLTALVWANTDERGEIGSTKNYFSIRLGTVAILLIGIGLASGQYSRIKVAQDGFFEFGDLVLLDPELGEEFPIRTFEELGVEVNENNREISVLIVRGNCQHCSEFLSYYRQRLNRQAEVFVVVLPPEGNVSDLVGKLDYRFCVYSGRKQIIIQVPWIIRIVDKKVVESRFVGS